MKPAVAREKKTKPAVRMAQDRLPYGWTTQTDISNFRENSDGTITIKANVTLKSPENKTYHSGNQVVRVRAKD